MKTVYKWYCRLERGITAAAFFMIIVLTFSNAVLRKANHPIVATDDVCTLLFAWVSFLGADIALKSNRLVGMDLVTSKLPIKIQKAIMLIVYLLMFSIFALFIVKGWELARMNWARFFNTLPISYGWVTLSLPLCCFMMLLTLSIKIVQLLIHFMDDSYPVKPKDLQKGEEAAA